RRVPVGAASRGGVEGEAVGRRAGHGLRVRADQRALQRAAARQLDVEGQRLVRLVRVDHPVAVDYVDEAVVRLALAQRIVALLLVGRVEPGLQVAFAAPAGRGVDHAVPRVGDELDI